MNNPFVTNGYAGAEYFCDRVEETQRIMELLTNENNMALISPRRIGKTELHTPLLQPALHQRATTFVIDIYSTSSVSDLVNMFGKAIIDELRPKRTLGMGEIPADNIIATLGNIVRHKRTTVWGIGIGTRNPETTLDEIFTYLNHADKPCLVAIDEFSKSPTMPTNAGSTASHTHTAVHKRTLHILRFTPAHNGRDVRRPHGRSTKA